MREIVRGGLDLALPPHCPACTEPGAELCEICRRQFVCVPRSGCVRCGAPVAPNGRCLASHRPLQGLRQLVAPYRFVGTAGRLVRRFKLDADASAGHWLRRAMADAWRQCGRTVRPVVVAVPLHRLRRRRRGFDQARWLAAGIASRLKLRLALPTLVRSRATAPQGGARVCSRTQNVRGAFVVRRPAQICDRDVLLVDDVFTSGATARACAERLTGAGARSVSVLVACRS